MNLWPFRRRGAPDPEAFLAELARSHPGGRYTKSMDAYRDFRRLFLGSEQGKRVLYEILGWCGMFQPSVRTGQFNPNEIIYHEGERNIGLKLMYTMNAEPTAKLAKAVNVRPER